jgi:hypothetical protein
MDYVSNPSNPDAVTGVTDPPRVTEDFRAACAALLADLASVPWLQKRLERYAAAPARWACDEQKAATWIASQLGDPMRWPEAAPLLRRYREREGPT